MVGGKMTCEDCKEEYSAGTDLSKYGCRCRKAKIAAVKASREALGSKPEAPADGSGVGGKKQCEDCWEFYQAGTNLSLYGCACFKAKAAAIASGQ